MEQKSKKETRSKKKNLLTKACKGIAYGDVSNTAIRNILAEISKDLYGPFTNEQMYETMEFFDWKCPYTGKDLKNLIDNNLGGYVTDHIYPQNKEWCGLNVKGNLIIVDKDANAKKHNLSVETFLNEDTKVLTNLDEQGLTRKERLAKIQAFQKQCCYDPEQVRKIIRPLMEKHYDEIRLEQEECIRETLEALKAINAQPLPTEDISESQKADTISSSEKTAKAVIKKYTNDEKIKVAAYYLQNNVGLVQVEEKHMHLEGNRGWAAKAILNELGIDTSRKSVHKGLLAVTNIDDAITNATGTFKTTLQEIKKQGL